MKQYTICIMLSILILGSAYQQLTATKDTESMSPIHYHTSFGQLQYWKDRAGTRDTWNIGVQLYRTGYRRGPQLRDYAQRIWVGSYYNRPKDWGYQKHFWRIRPELNRYFGDPNHNVQITGAQLPEAYQNVYVPEQPLMNIQ